MEFDFMLYWDFNFRFNNKRLGKNNTNAFFVLVEVY